MIILDMETANEKAVQIDNTSSHWLRMTQNGPCGYDTWFWS